MRGKVVQGYAVGCWKVNILTYFPKSEQITKHQIFYFFSILLLLFFFLSWELFSTPSLILDRNWYLSQLNFKIFPSFVAAVLVAMNKTNFYRCTFFFYYHIHKKKRWISYSYWKERNFLHFELEILKKET